MDNAQPQNTTPEPQQSPVPTPPTEKVKPQASSKTPIIIMTIVTIFSLALSGYLAYQNYKLSQQINESNEATPTLTPAPTTDPNAGWKIEKWSTESNSDEAFIPGVTYMIERPEMWIFSNNLTKVNGLDCFDIRMSDKENTVSIRIEEICTGWSAVDDKTELPSDYELVKEKQGVLNGQQDFRYLVRSEKSLGTITYMEGRGTEDNISGAFFTNAVMITAEEEERDTHSYFSPVRISAIYEVGHSSKDEYIKMLDRVVSSFVMTEIQSSE
jgi:hypothetical protein